MQALSAMLKKLADDCHQRSRINGFWESVVPQDPEATLEVAAKIGLIGAECSELLEAWRLQDPYGQCSKDERMTHLDEEAADIFIRLLDLCAFLDIDLGTATALKMAHNSGRPYKHSKRF